MRNLSTTKTVIVISDMTTTDHENRKKRETVA